MISQGKTKNQKYLVDFLHRKMTLKIRMGLLLTVKTKKNIKPRFFYTHQVGAEAKLIHP